MEHLIDGRDPDVPSEDKNQPISCSRTGEDETKPERCALVWTRLVISLPLNIRPLNGLLQ